MAKKKKLYNVQVSRSRTLLDKHVDLPSKPLYVRVCAARAGRLWPRNTRRCC